MTQIHNSIVLPFSKGVGGALNYPKNGKVMMPPATLLGISAMPAGIMVHFLSESYMPVRSKSGLVLPVHTDMSAPNCVPWQFACVADGEEVDPEGFEADNYVGHIVIPPGIGLHVYMRMV